MSITTPDRWITANTFRADVQYIESHMQRVSVGQLDMPVLDIGSGEPLVFVPILEHLEWVYARQVRAFSRSRRVVLYRRHESRARLVGLAERAEELRQVLDSLELSKEVDLVGHGDAAMVLFEFAARYPWRCRSLSIIAQGADYQIAPHPFIWLLHELFLRLPVEHFLPAWFLRRIVINYIVARRPPSATGAVDQPALTYNESPCALPRSLIEEQFRKIALWPFVYKYSVLPIIHSFDMRERLSSLSMPVLLINRRDDALSPEAKTRRLAEQLPHCAAYHVVSGKERFFMYAEAEIVNQFLEAFLVSTKM